MKQVILGISGSIAAYKTPELIRLLIEKGFSVQPVVTKHALSFVTEQTLSTVAGSTVLKDMSSDDASIPHLQHAKNTESCLVIAPASANQIAKYAHGLADDVLSSLFLSFQGPKVIVPAMHTEMYENPITQKNIETLRHYGVHFLGPVTGNLACGDYGKGRFIDLETIVEKVQSFTTPQLNLSGKKLLISAGGTEEQLDPVRSISNKSSGKMGHTLAKLASFYGAEVTLVTSKTFPETPNVSIIPFTNTQELDTILHKETPHHDILYMAAAVSDFTPSYSQKKLRRSDQLTMHFEGTRDILKSLHQHKTDTQTFIGFCLADKDTLAELAQEKLEDKYLDFIVGNTAEAFGSDTRTLTILSKDGLTHTLDDQPLMQAAAELLKLPKKETSL